jgi:hypothetical protein
MSTGDRPTLYSGTGVGTELTAVRTVGEANVNTMSEFFYSCIITAWQG